MQSKEAKILILSPDGFTIGGRRFYTVREAANAIEEFLNRYIIQGFYHSTNRGRMSIDDLRQFLQDQLPLPF